MIQDSENDLKIFQKWGFGMAPIKSEVNLERILMIEEVLKLFQNSVVEEVDKILNSLSVIKGLFTRVFKQDQWDWFTVWGKLGRPGRILSKQLSQSIYDLRTSIKNNDIGLIEKYIEELIKLGLVKFLTNYKSDSHKIENDENIGKIYILSNRENRNLLKIGYTNRTVEERVKEINSATGVLIPYGVRAMWLVRSASEIESEIHQILSAYRIREDREFFQMDFMDAFKFINSYIQDRRKEI